MIRHRISLNEDEVLNVSDIKDNTNIIGSREILDIDVSQKNRMLLATSFGIVEYRSENKEFGTTVFTNLKVNSITSLNQKIYAATDDGLYVMDESINSNIGDFSKWKLLGTEEGLPTLYEGKHVRQWNNKLYFSDGLSLWESLDEGLSFSEVYTAENDFSINFLSKGNSFLIVGLRASNGSKVIYVGDQGIIEGANSCIDRIRYAVEDEKGQVWFADNFREYRYITAIDGECKRMSFNSPLTHQVSDIAIGNGQIAIASGGVSDAFGDLFSRDGIYIQKDNNWENINESNFTPIKENDLLNFFKLEFEPNTDRLMLGTFWGGIMALDTETREYEIYNASNSSLQGAIGDGKVRISDMRYDNEDRLWISNYNTPRPLVMKDKENNWYNFPVIGDPRVSKLVIDEGGNKWVVTVGSSSGVFVFNEGDDLGSSSDDQSRLINLNNSEITSSIVYTVEMDNEGDIWIGTAEGVVVFECGQDIFGSDCVGTRRKVLVDSIAAFLLENEEIVAIAVDGANRKWFGTRNGIFVQNEEGDIQIAKYDVDNSPLFDNEIIDMEYDGESGIMYVASNKGLQAIKTETTKGKNTHSSEVYAFQNPVDPDYRGPIAIKGLAENAIVKITDLSGKLVFETQAFGGQAIWNGNNISGQRASTGVYLVFSTGQSSFGDPDSYVSKILFID